MRERERVRVEHSRQGRAEEEEGEGGVVHEGACSNHVTPPLTFPFGNANPAPPQDRVFCCSSTCRCNPFATSFLSTFVFV